MSTITYCPKCSELRDYQGEQDYCQEHRPDNWRLWDEALKLDDSTALAILTIYAKNRMWERHGLSPKLKAYVPEYVAIKALEFNFELREKEAKARADARIGRYDNPLGRSWMETRFPAWKASFYAYYQAWMEEMKELGHDVHTSPVCDVEIGEILRRQAL